MALNASCGGRPIVALRSCIRLCSTSPPQAPAGSAPPPHARRRNLHQGGHLAEAGADNVQSRAVDARVPVGAGQFRIFHLSPESTCRPVVLVVEARDGFATGIAVSLLPGVQADHEEARQFVTEDLPELMRQGA